MDNYIYLVGCPDTREAAVVDPAWDVPAIMGEAEQCGLSIRHAILTHGHPDHMNGLEELMDATGAPVWIHLDEVEYMRKVLNFFGMSAEFLEQRKAGIRTVGDGDTLALGKVRLQFIHTPGHTPGSQCILAEKSLLSGDTLFIGACGRVDLPGSNPEKMWHSLNRKLRALDDEIVVYPGHDYSDRPTSTIGEEKRLNPHMQNDTVEGFLRTF